MKYCCLWNQSSIASSERNNTLVGLKQFSTYSLTRQEVTQNTPCGDQGPSRRFSRKSTLLWVFVSNLTNQIRCWKVLFFVEPEWPSGIQCCAHCTDSHGFEPWPAWTSTSTSQKGSAAMLTSIQSAGVAPTVNPRIRQVRKHAKRNPPWLALKPRTDVTRSPKQGYQ